MTRKALHLIFTLSLAATALAAHGQTSPSPDKQQRMLAEEKEFLANMKPGLQHTQMLAVRAAMNGTIPPCNRYVEAATRHRLCPKA